MGLDDVDLAANIIASEANPDANIIWGVALDKNMEDEMRITVIATGFDADIPETVEAPVYSGIGTATAQPEVKTAPRSEDDVLSAYESLFNKRR